MKQERVMVKCRERRATDTKPLIDTLLRIAAPCLLLFNTVQAKKNILLLMADDLNDWVGALGGHPDVRTPNIDKLAKKSVIFKNAYCPAPVCHPSRTAMLSGLRPSTTQIYGNEDLHFREVPVSDLAAHVRPYISDMSDHVTMVQHFKFQGYFTAKGGKIFHANERFDGDPVSWDEHLWKKSTGDPAPGDGFQAAHIQWGVCAESTEETDGWESAEFISAFIENGLDRPFFLAYGNARPHLPWYAPREFFDMYDPDTLTLPEVLENDLDDVPFPGRSDHSHATIVASGKWANAVEGYLASTSYADHCIGRVLDALEASPYKDSTIILMMGDHGWHLGEKEHWNKSTLWEEGVKTNLMIYDPSIGVSGVSNHVVNLQDLYPTLVDLTGGEAPQWLEGRSLRPILENPNNPDFLGWSVTSYWDGRYSFRTNKWAFVDHFGGQYELYDMIADPLQHTNLAKNPTAAHTELMQKLKADVALIIAGKDPINTDVYGEYLTPVRPNQIPGAPQLAAYKIYTLSVYDVKGRLVRSFKGKGPDVLKMIHYADKLGLPKGNFVYQVLDRNNKKIITNALNLKL